jgi:hypothetical protein
MMKMVSRSTVETSKDEKLVQDMLYRVRKINYMPDDIRSSLLDFRVDGIKVGKVRPRTSIVKSRNFYCRMILNFHFSLLSWEHSS